MSSDQIISTVWTVDDIASLQSTIDLLNTTLYSTGKQKWTEVVANQIRSEWSPFFQVEETKRKEYLVTLQAKLKEFKLIHLRIAFSPPQAVIERIGAWLRENVTAEIVLDIEVDPKLIMGAEISWQGKYADLSKKTQLDKLLEEDYGRV